MSGAIDKRVRLMVARGSVELVNDALKAQGLQVELLDDEIHDEVERLQNYGFTGVPHPGAEAVVVCVGGLRSHGIVIAVEDRRYRLTGLQDGEVAMYDDLGQVVHLKRDGIVVESPDKVTVIAPVVKVEADTATIEADTVNLGGIGGAEVARVGDTVSGGIITSGSAKVKAA